jgi:hypothetical protein
VSNTTCKIDGCTDRVASLGWCSKHYTRMHRHGDPSVTYRPRQIGSCSIPGCDQPKESKGWCEKHARRARLNGDPLIVKQGKPKSGERNHNWVGDAVSYEGWHSRIRNARGSADGYQCVDCGQQANDWSYDHASDSETTSPDGPYALDMDHYQPRCRRCHIALDFAYVGRGQH